MNQNNVQNHIRQITPEEIQLAQQGKQLTQEELQKTQVLNLQEVEETAKLEKLTSKKPALIVGIIGILFLTFGTTFQIAKSLSTKPKQAIEKRDTEEVVQPETISNITNLNCRKTSLNNENGTDTTFTISYDFEDNKLISFTKIYMMNTSTENETGLAAIQKYTTNYQLFLNPIEGYQITTSPTATNLTVTVQVNYLKLDLTKLDPIQQTHFSTKVDYPVDTDYETVYNDMISQNFICG